MRPLLLLLAVCLFAAADGPQPTIPVEKNPERHLQFLEIAKAGGVADGDIFADSEMTAAMAKLYGGETATTYKGQDAALR
jgi:hypothetical protein